jgi:hypothetical protein
MNPTDTTAPTGTPRQRRYTDAEQAAAMAVLAAHAGNCAAAAEVCGIPERTLRAWKRQEARPVLGTDRQGLAAENKEALARGIDKLGRRILRRMLKTAVDKEQRVSLRDGTVALGICIDKALLLRGEATTIVSTADAERLAVFRARYAALHPVKVEAIDQASADQVAAGPAALPPASPTTGTPPQSS